MSTRNYTTPVREICIRQRQGDPTAAGEFERCVAPSVRRIVKRLLRSDHDPSPRDPGMLTEAQKLLTGTAAAARFGQETIIDCVTQHCV